MYERVLLLDQDQEANTAFGNVGIVDNSPRDKPDSEGWNVTETVHQPSIATRSSLTVTQSPKAAWLLTAVSEGEEDTLKYYWYESEDTFTRSDLQSRIDNTVHELIYRVRKSKSVRYSEKLANNLLSLFNDAREEEISGAGISPESIRYFYIFLLLHTNLKCPIISLTPDNNIYASWKSNQNRLFSVHFLQNGEVRFVMFKPNDSHPDSHIRISGTATYDTLMEIVKSDYLLDWITE